MSRGLQLDLGGLLAVIFQIQGASHFRMPPICRFINMCDWLNGGEFRIAQASKSACRKGAIRRLFGHSHGHETSPCGAVGYGPEVAMAASGARAQPWHAHQRPWHQRARHQRPQHQYTTGAHDPALLVNPGFMAGQSQFWPRLSDVYSGTSTSPEM